MDRLIQKDKPALVLAPMEGVTDAPMRALLTRLGGFSHCVSEFIRISHEVLPDKVFYRHVPELEKDCRTPSGVPVQIQLLGGDPEKLAHTAQQVVRLGATAVDINFGCPAPTVNRHDGGATLLKYPDRIEKIVSAVREACPKFVSVSAKLRLGWEKMDDIYENAKRVENGGADWMTIHARTRVQGYSPPAHWHYVAETMKQVSIPVIVNGDIYSMETFEACFKLTQAKHYMLGRGALSEPGLARAIANRLGIPMEEGIFWGDDAHKWISLLEEFHTLNKPYGGSSGYSVRRIKQWINLASKRKPIPWFKDIAKSQSVDEIFEVLRAKANPCAAVGPSS